MNAIDTIDIGSLSTSDKLGLMERLWRDLSTDPKNIEVPEWHLKRLEEAQEAVADGRDEFIDIDQFESELQAKIELRRTR